MRTARIPQALAVMTRARFLGLGLVVLATLSGCGDNPLGPDPEDVTFDDSLGIDLGQMTKLSSGVYIQTVTQGTGTATVALSSKVTVNYVLWLADGKQLQAGTIPSATLDGFVVGFAQGVVGMKVGEVRKIVIPADLGYGPDDFHDIPGNSVLIFQVTLVSIG